MIIEQLRAVHDATPFRPFLMQLADGRSIPTKHREFIMAAPSGRTLSVHQPDGTLHVIDLLLVTDLEVKPAASAAGKRRKG